MFFFEKYRPKKPSDFLFNTDVLRQLKYLASNEDVPHIIISGPSGSGKKTLVKFLLEFLYDEDVNILRKRKYNINGSSTKKEIEILQSNYHIIIEPTSTNHDKYILQEIIKQYAMHKSFDIFKTKRKFKTIVIHNIENLANNSQAALRRTMERYAKTCRFIMVCNNLSKIMDPLRSRCRTFCVPLPSIENINTVIDYIAFMENIRLNKNDTKFILDNCNNNLKTAIWFLNCKGLNCCPFIALDEAFDLVVESILECRTGKNIFKIHNDIRTNIYNILITNIKGSEIINILVDKLIRKIDDDVINMNIIQYASKAEYNLTHGRRDITDIEYFISGVMQELVLNRNKEPEKSEKTKSKTGKLSRTNSKKMIKN
ncbi:putative replication factor c small subunit [Acanthamoeba polyphaga mimivirus]|uniref:Replication factor c small subunit n=1 Tax=Acanthamoeba polyphaga mimivirus Kroon TaxID=3069720 RepID=A0A0G2YAV7_9VIRU|nr:putative replication factor c small subunit [Acanthamoeba polyphaga mimivirus]AKI80211.1 putative replication factor c small subunit [Acanthamoeba polyphaga mimivirus Kroon]